MAVCRPASLIWFARYLMTVQSRPEQSDFPLFHCDIGYTFITSFSDEACIPALRTQTAATILQNEVEWKSITNPVAHGNPFPAVVKTSFSNPIPWCTVVQGPAYRGTS
ncbi:hypothetical protein EDD16DRAFT_745266 [Pisolithus croceorrhizus]|nr:hypothetical protein EDD16DRAFT_745266 [Pisolithus croceorrhizus]